MSAVEVIVAALAAGAGAGLKDTTSAAVQDAYTRLKDLLKRRVGDHDERIVHALQADETEPGVWQARIGDALTASGVTGDDEVLDAARRLLALTDPATAKTLNINVDHNQGAIGEFHAPLTFNQAPPVPPAPPAAD